ncbi:CheW protein [Cyanobacterium aponinum PCC 10605]|uniref:CheW protein n=2 Tax=Cyanobacterium TaxID=102234 RepID=K9Z954_CYAAP|nr:CheW protein [Cyanobacterium aponinum PCC 10605]
MSMSESVSISSKLEQLLPQLFENKDLRGDRYLRFQLDAGITALIPIDDVRESLLIDRDKITPVPKMSPFIMGVINSRDRVFLVMDLPLLVNLTPISAYAREYNLVVVNIAPFIPNNNSHSSELWLGLAVHKIEGITRTEQKPIKDDSSTPLFSEKSLDEYIYGWIIEQNQTLAVLDLVKIVKKSF